MAGISDFDSRDAGLFIGFRRGDEATHDSRAESFGNRTGHGDGRLAGSYDRHSITATQIVHTTARAKSLPTKGKRPKHRGARIDRV